jgi:hypothetical protein
MDWDKARSVEAKYGPRIRDLAEVVGTCTGILRKEGEPQACIRVHLKSPMERGELKDKKLPWELEGIPIDAVVTGEMRAFGGKP